MIKILIIQMQSIVRNKAANFEKVEKLLRGRRKSDLIILPELFATGWNTDNYGEAAEDFNNSITIKFLKDIAKKNRANVIGGTVVIREGGGKPRNSCPVINRAGDIIARYDKMHLYSYLGDREGENCERGTKPVMAHTDAAKAGITICYDIRFPELYRSYVYGGADILVNTAAWPKSRRQHWEILSKARAIENQTYMISVSQTGRRESGEYNAGHSMIISPEGRVIGGLGEEEDVLEAEIDLDEMKELRRNVQTLSDRHREYILEDYNEGYN